MKRILVTGGSGFLGSHLIERLLRQGHYVICVDNNFTGSMDNIKQFKNLDHFEFIRHDITLPLFIEVDEIYHLACPASPKAYQKNPLQTIKTNVVGTFNMLGLAKRLQIRILFTSTSEIYGDPEVSPQPESYWGNVNTLGPRACYDEGKRCAETIMKEYHNQHQVEIRIARIFNTYGPNMDQDDGRVVSNFIVQSLHGNDITIYGDGSQTRSFCYVSDTIEGLMLIMEGKEIGPYNVGNPNEMSIKSLALEIKKMVGNSNSILHCDLPQDDPKIRKPDISKINKDRAWTPKVDIEDGLQKTIDYFKNLL